MTFAKDFFIYYFALSIIIGLFDGLMKLFIIWEGLIYDFYFSFLDFEDKRFFWDWHYFSYLISPNEVLGLILVVNCEYLDVCVALLKPELVAFDKFAVLRPIFDK